MNNGGVKSVEGECHKSTDVTGGPDEKENKTK